MPEAHTVTWNPSREPRIISSFNLQVSQLTEAVLKPSNMKKLKSGETSKSSKVHILFHGLRNGRYFSRFAVALVFTCLLCWSFLNVVLWLMSNWGRHTKEVRGMISSCIDPLWCSAKALSINDLWQLRAEIGRATKDEPLNLNPAPLPSFELMNSVVGRDIGKELGKAGKEEAVSSDSTVHRPTSGIPIFLVTDIAVAVSPFKPIPSANVTDGTERKDGADVRQKESNAEPSLGLCTTHTKTVLLVVSARKNFQKRAVIRSSWANATDVRRMFPYVSIVFVIGGDDGYASVPSREPSRSSASQATKEAVFVQSEAATHGDAIFLNLTDSYRNLTYKVLSGYQWALRNCPAVEIIGKVDDDIFLDVWGTLRAIHRYVRVGEMAILGTRTPDDSIVRTQGHVHRVDATAYADTAYPYSMRGMAYYVTKSYAAVVLAATFGRKPLGLDDKYITGIWARKLGARQIFLNSPEGDYAMDCDALFEWIFDESGTKPLPLASLCADSDIHRMSLQKVKTTWFSREGNDRIVLPL